MTPSGRVGFVSAACLCMLAWAVRPTPGIAQIRGGVQVVENAYTFSTSGQPMWGTPVSFSEGIDLFFDTGDQAGSFGAFVGDEPVRFGFQGSGGVRAVFGLQASASITGGEVGVVFPLVLTIRAPEANSFRAGEEIMLTTAWEPAASGWSISTVAPGASFEVNSPFGIEATASAEACVFGCFGVDGVTVGYPAGLRTATAPRNVAEELLLYQMNSVTQTVSVPAVLPEPLDLPYEVPEDKGAAYGVLGTLDLPRAALPCPQDTSYLCVQLMHQKELLASANHTFVHLDLDLDTWLVLAIAKKNPLAKKAILGIEVPFDEFPFDAAPDGSEAWVEVFDAKFFLKSRETQNFRFSPNPAVTLTLPNELRYRVVDGSTEVGAGTGKSIPFRVGQTLFLTFPDSKTPLDVTSKYDLSANRLANETSFNLSGSTAFRALAYRVYIPDEINKSGDVWEDAFPAFSETVALPEYAQTLAGFGSEAGTSFSLDPEDPCIDVATDMEPGLLNGLGPAGTLVQTIEVENCGDVRVLMTQVTDALSVHFLGLPGFTVSGVSSNDLTTNAAWNGSGSTLAGTDELDVGQTSYVSIEFQAEPGNIYETVVAASGGSPIETPVAASDAGSFAVYAVDIDMDVFNGPGGPNAQIPVHFESTEALDVHDIDPTSIRLDGLAPVRWAVELRDEVGPEHDLVLHFMRQPVWDIVLSRLESLSLVSGVIAPDELTSIVDALLSGTADDASGQYADAIGNRNGRLDVGDLRAVIKLRERVQASLLANAGNGDETVITLPITGTMSDGTPLVGEDSFIVRNPGR